MVNGCEAGAVEPCVGITSGGQEGLRARARRAKVQIGCGLCKGERDEVARGHVGMVTSGHGAHARGSEAQRLGGSEEAD